MSDKAVHIKHIFDPFYQADLSIWESFSSQLQERTFKKNEIIKNSNEVEKYLNIIISGSTGLFIWNGKNEICLSLSYENDFFSDYLSFLRQEKTPMFTLALEDTTIWTIAHADLSRLYQRSVTSIHIGRIAAEMLYAKKQQFFKTHCILFRHYCGKPEQAEKKNCSLTQLLTKSQFFQLSFDVPLQKSKMKMTKKDKTQRIAAVLVFFLIAVAIRYATNKTGLLDHIQQNFLKIIIQGTGPAIGAFAAMLLFGIKSPLTLKGNAHYTIIPLFIFWILPVVTMGTFYFLQTGKFSIVVFPILVYALFEEIGWRGFLQPALSFIPKFQRILVISILWFIWHLNFELNSANLIFFLVLLFGSWGIGAVARRTNSLLAVAAFHAIYDIYTAMPIKTFTENAILIFCAISWLLYVLYFDKSGFATEKNQEQHVNSI